jgi:pimeloyl-ACP methyl ester carboxylesterase
MVADCLAVLDGYGVERSHLVGVSAGGAFVQLLATDFPDRVLSLVLISTSPATPGDRGLPSPTAAFREFVATAHVDWSDTASVVEYFVGYSRMLSGGRRRFDEEGRRALVERDVNRARNIAAIQNHDALAGRDRSYRALSTITAPALVVHGTADPMFPPEHGEALAAEIPRARLLLLDGAGHGVDPADWETIVAALIQHSAPMDEPDGG